MDREIYSNAPLVLTALEIRHPSAAPLSRVAQKKIKQLLSSHAPLPRPATLANFQATIGGATETITEEAPRYFSRDKTTAITFRIGSVVVETTRYVRWERLRELMALALTARGVDPVDGIERLGLRYINEIRVPADTDKPLDWDPWVNPALLGPTQVGAAVGLHAQQWQGITVFDNGEDRAIVLRHGPRDGYAVDPAGDLKRPAPPPGPFFLLDIDSFWQPTSEVPEFDPQILLEASDQLHAPVCALFEELVTERLRQEVFRHAG